MGKIDRRTRIRRDMIKNFHYGGKRCKIAWIRKWWGAGDSILNYIKLAGAFIFGGQGIILSDMTNLILFILVYIPTALYLGCAYIWWDLYGIESYTGQILDPFAFQVKRKLNIKDKNGY